MLCSCTGYAARYSVQLEFYQPMVRMVKMSQNTIPSLSASELYGADVKVMCQDKMLEVRSHFPEVDLWVTVFELSISDAKKLVLALQRQGDWIWNDANFRRSVLEIKTYFRSNREYIGSFVWICEQLDINASLVRDEINNKYLKYLEKDKEIITVTREPKQVTVTIEPKLIKLPVTEEQPVIDKEPEMDKKEEQFKEAAKISLKLNLKLSEKLKQVSNLTGITPTNLVALILMNHFKMGLEE